MRSLLVVIFIVLIAGCSSPSSSKPEEKSFLASFSTAVRQDPQAFGLRVLALQEEISSLQNKLKQKISKEEKLLVKDNLHSLKGQLAACMTVIRLFESPGA